MWEEDGRGGGDARCIYHEHDGTGRQQQGTVNMNRVVMMVWMRGVGGDC